MPAVELGYVQGPRQPVKGIGVAKPAGTAGTAGGGASSGIAAALKKALAGGGGVGTVAAPAGGPAVPGAGGGGALVPGVGGVAPMAGPVSSQNPSGNATVGATLTPPGGYTAQPPQISNFAQSNPGLDAAVARYNARTDEQKGKEGAVDPNLQTQINRLGESLSTDESARMVDRATSRARDQLVGIGRGAEANIARAQGNNPFARGAVNTKLAAAAARAAAGASANVEMGERARKDALILGGQGIMAAPGQEKLTREGRVNELTQGGVSAAMAPAGLALDQQRLGLEQWRAGDQSARDTARLNAEIQQNNVNSNLATRREEMDRLESLLRLSGY